MKNNSASAGITACDVLAIVFVVLKLCKVINWSWWWVLSPVWISIAVYAVVVIVVALMARG